MPMTPDRPFATLSFGKDGTIRPNTEHTFLEQEELELLVARKFTATLKRWNLYDLDGVQAERSRDHYADVSATKEDGSKSQSR